MQPARIHIPNVREDERIGSSFNHLIRVVEETNHAQSKVIWDFKDVHFLHPFFLAPLAIFKCQSEKEIRCENIYEHSESPNGYLFSQFLEHEGCIDLCIADTGITIFRSYEKAGLFQAEIGQDESEALRMANEGRSTKNRPGAESRGYGISTSKRMLVEGLGGSFFMISGGAFHRYEKNSLNYYAEVKDFFHWNGTLILLRIPINTPDNFNYINYLE